MIKKIISGGQTGADQGGLLAGKALGIETGGTMPRGFRTENGLWPFAEKEYGMQTTSSFDYTPRTEINVLGSDGTIVFGNLNSPGSRLTIRLCTKHNRPCFTLPDLDNLPDFIADFQDWVKENNIEILNVAGNRESKSPGIEQKVKIFLAVSIPLR